MLHLTFCSLFVLWAHPRSFEGIYLGDSVGGAGSGARASGLITRAPGAPRSPPFGQYDPEAGSQRGGRCPMLAGTESRPEACGARLRENHRSEAPQGAPVRVMGRPSLPITGRA